MNTLQWLQVMLSYLFQASLVIGVAWGLDQWASASHVKSRIWTACYVSLLGLSAAAVLLPRLQWLDPWSNLKPGELLWVANAERVLGISLLATWTLGTSLMLVRWTTQFVLLQRFMRSCSELTEREHGRLLPLVESSLLEVKGRRVAFRISPERLGPFCYQFHQPIVFLPRSIINGEEAVLGHILQHELTHLRTQHPLQLFLQ